MDIVTHALIGMATSAELMPTHPALACGLVMGNVAPDLDAFSRIGGKHAFLRFHQTYTHSLAAILLPLVIAGGLRLIGSDFWAEFMVGLTVGMAMHVGLDLTNTYGVRCLWPLSSRRFALGWIFFIDAPILLLTAVALIATWWPGADPNSARIVSAAYVVALLLTVGTRAFIARRAQQLATSGGTGGSQTAVIPTTWSPFEFLVCRQDGRGVESFRLNAIDGRTRGRETLEVFDDVVPAAVRDAVEWRVMRGLSPFYHAVERIVQDGAETVVCRDLRIRNFDTRFGTLTCRIDRDGRIVSKQWEV